MVMVRIMLISQGMLSRDELIVGYTKILENEELAKIEVDKIIEIVDINKSG